MKTVIENAQEQFNTLQEAHLYLDYFDFEVIGFSASLDEFGYNLELCYSAHNEDGSHKRGISVRTGIYRNSLEGIGRSIQVLLDSDMFGHLVQDMDGLVFEQGNITAKINWATYGVKATD